MKKTYITPLTIVEFTQAETMIEASNTNIGGDSKLDWGKDETTPTEADVKEFDFFGDKAFWWLISQGK